MTIKQIIDSNDPKLMYRYLQLNGYSKNIIAALHLHPAYKTKLMKLIYTKPFYAYNYSVDFKVGPDDKLREAACKDSSTACWYAIDVDKCYREDTWNATISNLWSLSDYLRRIKVKPNDMLRKVACQEPGLAQLYAELVDKQPHDDTRTAACSDPAFAYQYALRVDKKPCVETRDAACKESRYAYEYARYIDNGATNETRDGACKEPKYAYMYAKYIDRGPSTKTRWAARPESYWISLYLSEVDKSKSMHTDPKYRLLRRKRQRLSRRLNKYTFIT